MTDPLTHGSSEAGEGTLGDGVLSEPDLPGPTAADFRDVLRPRRSSVTRAHATTAQAGEPPR